MKYIVLAEGRIENVCATLAEATTSAEKIVSGMRDDARSNAWYPDDTQVLTTWTLEETDDLLDQVDDKEPEYAWDMVRKDGDA